MDSVQPDLKPGVRGGAQIGAPGQETFDPAQFRKAQRKGPLHSGIVGEYKLLQARHAAQPGGNRRQFSVAENQFFQGGRPPSSPGTWPLRAFPSSTRWVTLDRLPSSDGIGPERLLSPRYSAFRLSRLPSSFRKGAGQIVPGEIEISEGCRGCPVPAGSDRSVHCR